MVTAYVLYCSEVGLFIGECMGLIFWSLLDPAGQTHAHAWPTHADAATALAHLRAHTDADLSSVTVHAVQAADPHWVTSDEAVAAGLLGWDA